MAMATVSHALNHSAAMETVNTQGDNSIPIVEQKMLKPGRSKSSHACDFSGEPRSAARDRRGEPADRLHRSPRTQRPACVRGDGALELP